MCHFEANLVFNVSVRHSFWYRYVDDTFTMFDIKDTANEFLRYLRFTIEFEQDNEVPFLDILVKRCPDNSFMTSVYRKKKNNHRPLHQVGFIHTSQIQNKSHPHTHRYLSLFPNLFLCLNITFRYSRSHDSFGAKWLPSRHYHIQRQRCFEQTSKQARHPCCDSP